MTGFYKRIFQGAGNKDEAAKEDVSKQLKKISEQLVYLERKVDTLLGKRNRRDQFRGGGQGRHERHSRPGYNGPNRKQEGLETDLGRQVDFLPEQNQSV